jgi:hypothetical protein
MILGRACPAIAAGSGAAGARLVMVLSASKTAPNGGIILRYEITFHFLSMVPAWFSMPEPHDLLRNTGQYG